MNLLILFIRFLTNGKVDKMVSINMTESFTGNEKYWKPSMEKVVIFERENK